MPLLLMTSFPLLIIYMTSLALGQNVSIEDSNNDINDNDGFSTNLFFGFERRQVLNDRISLFHINRKLKNRS